MTDKQKIVTELTAAWLTTFSTEAHLPHGENMKDMVHSIESIADEILRDNAAVTSIPVTH